MENVESVLDELNGKLSFSILSRLYFSFFDCVKTKDREVGGWEAKAS